MAEPLRIVVVGQAGHGKSTLIARLRNHSATPPDGGAAGFETERRRFTIIDAPGQDALLRDMVTGAATADAAIAVIDAREGAAEPSRRQFYLLALLGVRRVIVAVNKMDLVGYSQDRFQEVARETRDYLDRIDVVAAAIIPISALGGQMVAARAPELDWSAEPTLVAALDGVQPGAVAPDVLPLRFSVQDVYKFDERRILAGRVESGVLRVGDQLAFAPGRAIAKVASIEDWNQPVRRLTATAGDTIGITLEQRAFVERGHIGAPAAEPIRMARRIGLRIFWLAAEPLIIGRSLTIRLAAGEYRVAIRAIDAVIDLATLGRRSAARVLTNEVADIIVESADPIPVDRHAALPRTGRAVLTDGADALGGAIVRDFVEVEAVISDAPAARGVAREERERRYRHRGAVLWLTGLPGSGKSTLAAALERALFDGGMHAVALDGDAVRRGLSRDLGLDPADRAENARRVAEAAKILADAGNIAIVALASPMRSDRDRARAIVGGGFAEIHVQADLALCEARDPKGAYARARRGEEAASAFGAQYEPPVAPDFAIDTGKLDIAQSVDRLIGFVESRFHDPRIDQNLVEPEWSV